jgi:hypothetical protein
MLALRPNCECCDKDLPPDAQDAMICTCGASRFQATLSCGGF